MEKPRFAQVKGTDIVIIRTLLKEKGEAVYADCCTRISPEAKRLLEIAVPTMWLPNPLGTEIMEQSAKLLFPGRADDLEHLGRECARRVFTGVYRIFLRVTTLPFLIKRVPSVWALYHSVGKATVTVWDEKNGGEMIVTGAPDVSVKNLRLVTGFSMQALEMAGARNLRCRLYSEDPSRWRWEFNWEA